MKRFLLILSLLFVASVPLLAQEEDDDANEKIQDKMSEYIQKRLDISKDEAAKFSPVFVRYFKEWRQTLRDNKNDRLIMQQKVVDLRLKYRPEFRGILGERRGDLVYRQQDLFIKELRDLRRERLLNNPRPQRRQ